MNSSLRSEEINSMKLEKDSELEWREKLNNPINNYDTVRSYRISLMEKTDRIHEEENKLTKEKKGSGRSNMARNGKRKSTESCNDF